jgi:hypothetical protein
LGNANPLKGWFALSDQNLSQLRVGIARAERKSKRTGDSAPVVEARREYAAAKIAEHIKRVVDDAPPLTDEQIARISAVLHRGGEPNAAT